MKAYLVRNVHNINDAIEKLERALARRRIHFLDVKYRHKRVRITLLDMSDDEAIIRDIEFSFAFTGEGAIRFYESKSKSQK